MTTCVAVSDNANANANANANGMSTNTWFELNALVGCFVGGIGGLCLAVAVKEEVAVLGMGGIHHGVSTQRFGDVVWCPLAQRSPVGHG